MRVLVAGFAFALGCGSGPERAERPHDVALPTPTATSPSPRAAPADETFHRTDREVEPLHKLEQLGDDIKTACRVVARYGAPKESALGLGWSIRDTRGLGIHLRFENISVVAYTDRELDAPAREAALEALVRDIPDEVVDCGLDLPGLVLFVVGVRNGDFFRELAPLDRALAFIRDRAAKMPAATAWRDQALVVHFANASDADRARHEAELPAVQEAARRWLAEPKMDARLRAAPPSTRELLCAAVLALPTAVKLTTAEDKKLQAKPRKACDAGPLP